MDSSPKIQFMIPVHNNASVLAECIRSILAQSEQSFEIHVVDDGSTDGSGDVVAKFTDPRIHHHYFTTRTSLPGNFNRCMELATAPVYALIHADDRPAPDFATRMLAACDQFPSAALIFCKARLIDENGHVIHPLKQRIKNAIHTRRGPVLEGPRGLEMLASYNHLMCPCAIYRKDLLPPGLRFPEGYRYLTDQTFWLTALAQNVQIATLEDVLYEHRVHNQQLSASLRANGSTLAEVRRFVPNGPQRLHRIWQRYGAKLAFRQMLAARSFEDARIAAGEIGRFVKDATRRSPQHIR